MIYLSYLGESKNINYKHDDKRYLIVRRPVGNIPRGFIHLPQLSPSLDLFEKAQKWKTNTFTDLEMETLRKIESNTDEDSWWLLYEPIFMEELAKRKEVKEAINILKQDVNDKLNVYLFCYCKDLHKCHRYLVGKYLKELGLEIDFGSSSSAQKSVNNNENQLSFFND